MDSALESIKLIPDQIKQVWEEIEELEFSEAYRSAKLIAITGMGGSIYNYYVLKALFGSSLTVPLVKINNYGLPGCLNEESLLLGSSYSGTTEEIINNVTLASQAKIKTIVFSQGGPLIEFAKEKQLPYYQFDQIHNPSKQPRMGQGYMLFSAIGLLTKLGYLKEKLDLSFLDEIGSRMTSIQESATELANKVMDKELFYIAADHLSGNAHIVRNQTNETAKLYADYNLIPELNHHLMEGLKNPNDLKRSFIFIESELYLPRNLKRFKLTQEVIEKNSYPVLIYKPQSSSKVGQFVETLIWGGYLTFELGRAYREDPTIVPWVDYFKEKLGKLSELEK